MGSFKIKNIYEIVNQKSDFLFEKYKLVEENNEKNDVKDILKQKLFELNMNICNSYIYNYKFQFSKEEMYFIDEYNLYDLINEFIDILGKEILKKS
jgi:hypothetical protein